MHIKMNKLFVMHAPFNVKQIENVVEGKNKNFYPSFGKFLLSFYYDRTGFQNCREKVHYLNI